MWNFFPDFLWSLGLENNVNKKKTAFEAISMSVRVFILLSTDMHSLTRTLIVQAICMGPLLPTISTLWIWLFARASRAGWVMSVFCRKTGDTFHYDLFNDGIFMAKKKN